MYLKGLGVRQDDVRAADWYRRAAQLGRPEAQFFLGTLYYLGRGVPQNDQLAHVWCEIALARGMTGGAELPGCRVRQDDPRRGARSLPHGGQMAGARRQGVSSP